MDFTSPMRTVTSSLDGPVLGVLARSEHPITGREVARRAGQSSHSGVRGALLRLAAQGIVTAIPAGRAVIYQLNRQHLAAPHVLALVDLSDELVRRVRDRLRAWDPPVVWAVLVGAFARGEAREDASLDLLIVRPGDVDEHDRSWRVQVDALQRDITVWTGNGVRIAEFGIDELEQGAAPSLVREAMADGIDLMGSPGAF